MSVDIVVYKMQPLSDDELKRIGGMDVYDVNEIDDWDVKAFSLEEISERPKRFEHIKDFLRTVELLHTKRDFKACCIAHGMPAETKTYSYKYVNDGYDVRFDDKQIRITQDDLNAFATTKMKKFYVAKRKLVNADIDWSARALMKALEETVKEEQDVDLSYIPIHLNNDNCELLCKTLVKLYDENELFLDSHFAEFMIELMRAMYNPENNVFIEFQD